MRHFNTFYADYIFFELHVCRQQPCNFDVWYICWYQFAHKDSMSIRTLTPQLPLKGLLVFMFLFSFQQSYDHPASTSLYFISLYHVIPKVSCIYIYMYIDIDISSHPRTIDQSYHRSLSSTTHTHRSMYVM